MEFWLNKKQCTGCGACSNVCPKGAISMVEDENGFKYPVIDQEKCINCGLCKRTCPILGNQDNNSDKSVAYASWAKDADTRYNSTSGGIFTEIANYIIDNGGYVAGARYNDDNMVEHTIIDNKDDVKIIRQSKYLQSDTKKIFSETKKLLDSDKMVAFCGAPCQIAGLKSFLKRKYDNLLTIEFICRGMNSPKAYRSWLREIENTENKSITRVWFKYKENGWKKSPKCTRIDFSDGSYKVYNGKDNLFMSGYLDSNLYIRPSCGDCKFKGIDRVADITLADFWGIKEELDDDKGTSLILANSTKGIDIIKKISKKLYIEERPINEIYEGNMCFTTSVKINKKSEEFLSSLNDNNFSKQLKKYSKRNLIVRLLRKIKRVGSRIYKNIKK